MDSSRNKVLVAFGVGGLLVLLALYLKLQTPPIESEESLAVVATSDAPRARIEITDSDGDGVPDWQEALQRSEPIIVEDATEPYEPETRTEQLAIDFFQDMMLSRNMGVVGQDPTELAEQAVAQISDLALDELYGVNDIVLSQDNSLPAVKAYSNQMATIVLEQEVSTDSLSEVEILKQAFTLDQPEMLDELDPILAGYKDMIDRSLATPVPSNYAKEHLDLINVYNAIYNDILAMKEGFNDPALVVIRLRRYEEDANTLFVALLNLQKKVLLEGVTFTESDPAYRFIVQ